MAPCHGCTQMRNFKLQCTMKLGALGGLWWDAWGGRCVFILDDVEKYVGICWGKSGKVEDELYMVEDFFGAYPPGN